MDWLPIILALIAALPGVMALVREYRFGRPDALKKYEELVNDLVAKNEKLTERVECLEAELESYRLGVLILISQLQEMGVQPKWKPGKKKTTGELRAKHE